MDVSHEPAGDSEVSTTPRPVPLHPEAVDGDEDTLRWVIPAATLGFVGVPSSLPEELQELLDEDVLAALSVEPTAVRTTLTPGQTWRDHGGRVRGVLQQALGIPDRWQPADAGSSDDDLLRAAVQVVIDGEVGDYIRSHGGRVELLGAHDHDVEVALAGACSHCPAAEMTLTCRIETGIRALYPDLGRVTARSESSSNITRRVLGMFPTRAG